MTPPTRQLSQIEFIAMVAMMTSSIAFSIDAMLPALPEIGAALSPDDRNKAQLVIMVFMLGMGLGTLFTGPLSDSFGRKPVIIAGSLVYILAAAVGALAQSLEILLFARMVQGIGASGPRVVAIALIRDLYAGREMARITSFVMILFTIVPALAPLIGTFIIAQVGWRGIFFAFCVFSAISTVWVMARQPETLQPAARRPFRFAKLRAAVSEMLSHPMARGAIFGQILAFGMLFSMLSSVQQIFDESFGRGAEFAYWFGAIALIAGISGFVNAKFVMRLGMRKLVLIILSVQVVASLAMVLLWVSGLPLTVVFGGFVLWQTTVFFQAGMTIGNLQALAMEPMGHIAGFAASVLGSIATVGAVVLAVPVGLAFNGTPVPLACAIGVEAALGVLLMRYLAKLERPTLA